MGFFDFLKKRRDDDEDFLGPDFGPEPGLGAHATPGYPMPSMPGMEPMPMAPQYPGAVGAPQDTELMRRTIETLNYKIDTLKATLDNINARLASIEAWLQEQRRGGYY